jgi:hypothetical protein
MHWSPDWIQQNQGFLLRTNTAFIAPAIPFYHLQSWAQNRYFFTLYRHSFENDHVF